MPSPEGTRLGASSMQTKVQKVKTFARQWIKLTWLDLVCMAILGGATTAVSLWISEPGLVPP